MNKLTIKNLHVEVEGKKILHGVDLEINAGETIALLGPNGHGKSTLLNAIMGHPRYIITEGTITLDGADVLAMSVDERARAGLFLGMQYPAEVPGVINADFIRSALNAKREKQVSTMELFRLINKVSGEMGISLDLANRSLNEGFSGGEKKRNEILQMVLLQPDFVMLDEIDSGLDVDALQVVAQQINKLQTENKSFLVISHYARLYSMINPTKVAIIINGRVVLVGGPELIEKVDSHGYEWLAVELGIKIEKENVDMNTVSIGACAVQEGI